MEFLKYGVGWLLAIVALLASAYYFFYNKRKKKLEIDVISRSLIIGSARAHNELKVSIEDRRISDPYMVEFIAKNIGHKDISSKDFDAEKPLNLSVGAEVVALFTVPDGESSPTVQVSEDSRHIFVLPGKMAVGHRHRMRLLVDGEPVFKIVEDPLIDTDIIIGRLDVGPQLKLIVRRLIAIVLMIMLLVGTLAVMNANQKSFGLRFGKWLFFNDALVGPTWAVILLWLGVTVSIALLIALFRLMNRTLRLSSRLSILDDKRGLAP